MSQTLLNHFTQKKKSTATNVTNTKATLTQQQIPFKNVKSISYETIVAKDQTADILLQKQPPKRQYENLTDNQKNDEKKVVKSGSTQSQSDVILPSLSSILDTLSNIYPLTYEYGWEDEALIEKYLRSFDLDMKFGPNTGLSRLARYHRSLQYQLNPPQSIYHLLLYVQQKQKQEDEQQQQDERKQSKKHRVDMQEKSITVHNENQENESSLTELPATDNIVTCTKDGISSHSLFHNTTARTQSSETHA